ncbi:MAG TPA: hypothetical protein VFB12_13980 [Ktedonobacteraceae bacterium]|nr:hypothetical protein [Ktedonobacteraceae bacterium]
MTYTFAQYAANRDALLQRMIETFTKDERVVAAWLEGSFGRGAQDDLSDLDLRVVIADEYADQLCSCTSTATTQITCPQRLAFIEQFGPALVLREDVSWVPGGCFNLVIYRETAVNVDWVLIPQSKAERPIVECRLLLDKVGIPLALPPAPESLEERIQLASRDVGFFWLMMAIGIKYMLRGEFLSLYSFLSAANDALQNVQRLVAGRSWHVNRPLTTLALTQQEQMTFIRQLCNAMLEVMPRLEALGGTIPEDPMAVIELWLSLVPNQ